MHFNVINTFYEITNIFKRRRVSYQISGNFVGSNLCSVRFQNKILLRALLEVEGGGVNFHLLCNTLVRVLT